MEGRDSHLKMLGMLVGDFCFDPYDILKKGVVRVCSMYQNRQHTGSETRVS